MRLNQLTEVRYAGSLKADPVLYTLWKVRNGIQKDNLSVVKIDDPVLSKKRAVAIARYVVRVIVPEVLDGIGMTDEAQTLRDLPADVDLEHAHDVAVANAADAANAANDADAAYNVVFYAALAAHAADHAADHAAAHAVDAADYAANAAYYASAITNKQRHLYYLNQMIKLAANIRK